MTTGSDGPQAPPTRAVDRRLGSEAIAGTPEPHPDDETATLRRRVDELEREARRGVRKIRREKELRPYQVEGFHFLSYLSTNRFGGILADDMGLGKTMQALAWVFWLRENAEDGQPAPALVVAPKSVVFNWVREAHRFTPHLRVLDYTGSQRRQWRAF